MLQTGRDPRRQDLPQTTDFGFLMRQLPGLREGIRITGSDTFHGLHDQWGRNIFGDTFKGLTHNWFDGQPFPVCLDHDILGL